MTATLDQEWASDSGAPLTRITTFHVRGIPAAQGSMKIMPTRRILPGVPLIIHSARELMTCVTMTSDNDKLKPWRKEVKEIAQASMLGVEFVPKGHPLKVVAIFSFPYLQKHYKSDGVTLRDDKPFYKATDPDTDKLARAIGDSMTGVVYEDDKQIAWWDVKRIYSATPGVSVSVYAL